MQSTQDAQAPWLEGPLLQVRQEAFEGCQQEGAETGFVLVHLMRTRGLNPDQIDSLVNRKSGLLGMSGISNDMREIEKAAAAGDHRALLAFKAFCYRVRKYLGSYLAVLGGADSMVFGGGIGENAPSVRDRICSGMEWCGLKLHADRNRAAIGLAPGHAAKISMDDSRLEAYVVAADEETWIARETVRCVRDMSS